MHRRKLCGGAAAALAFALARRLRSTPAKCTKADPPSPGAPPNHANDIEGKSKSGSAVADPSKQKRKKKGGDLGLFMKQFRKLLPLILPGLFSKEAGLLALHTATLVARTILTVYTRTIDGQIVKQIVGRNPRGFSVAIAKLLAIAVPGSFVNSLIRYMESKLTIAFRTRMVNHTYDKYMAEQTYYRVGNLDSRVANVDQNLTEDVSKFCGMVAHLWSHISKPLLDIGLICYVLFSNNYRQQNKGMRGFAVAFSPLVLGTGVIAMSGFTLKTFSPRFGKMISDLATREGHLRFLHSRIITHAEEIAFYNGHEVEKKQLQSAYARVEEQTKALDEKKLWFVVLEQFLMKYVWYASGMVMIAGPQLFAEKGDAADRAQNFTVSQGLLESAADAVERIMSSYKEVMELAGYTHRVTDLLTVLDDMHAGRYQKKLCASSYTPTLEVPVADRIKENQDHIWIKDLPIVTPSGDCLVPKMSIDFTPGQHILITGPNGCGKSSLFRIVSGLWPAYDGRLGKVSKTGTFYIPQRPYLTIGDLRSQVIYPDTVAQMRARGRTDAELLEILSKTQLSYVVEREGGLGALSEWKDVLSGGEKQRLGMARLYYHRPQYALLDECTSAVSIDVEGAMYQYAKDLGITLLTITHRPTLWKFHSHLLRFDGEGGYTLAPLDASKQLTLKEEKDELVAKLEKLDLLRLRLDELNTILGES